MLKVQEIREIIKLIDQSSIDEFTFESEGTKVKLKKNTVSVTPTVVAKPAVEESSAVKAEPTEAASPASAPVKEAAEQPAAQSPAADETLHQITSPMVGTFYQSPSPEAQAFVTVGDKVKNDSVVCIVEAMKLFNEIEAEVNGEIVEVLAKDGQLVEYGQPLFLVRQN
ncbi:acetyl-CoA carboxylase biotin carboxyl carrier protein [Chungangia koreensis]|uniref:Biotin carboxyl carrier protein of acetyl-CoA carboxylase n=1 Tax=Chungangia koreensis TaxID=752657 RepID=A0ABV8X5E6_9LACT